MDVGVEPPESDPDPFPVLPCVVRPRFRPRSRPSRRQFRSRPTLWCHPRTQRPRPTPRCSAPDSTPRTPNPPRPKPAQGPSPRNRPGGIGRWRWRPHLNCRLPYFRWSRPTRGRPLPSRYCPCRPWTRSPVAPVPPDAPVAAEPDPELPVPVVPLFAVPVLPVAPEGWGSWVMPELWPLPPSHAPSATPPAISSTAQIQSAAIRAVLSGRRPSGGSSPCAISSNSGCGTTGTSSVFSVSSPT